MAMRAKMMLAEAATQHPDGTVSMLRAGISHVRGKKAPFTLQAVLVVRIDADISDTGEHQFDVQCMDEDGKQVLPKIEGTFEVPEGGGTNSLILGFSVGFPRAGRFMFAIRVDMHELDTWTITTAPISSGGEKK